MRTNLELPTLEKLQHTTVATPLVGSLDDRPHRDVIDQLGDHAGSVILGPSDHHGDPHALTEHDGAGGPDDSEPSAGAPMVTATAGDAR